MLYLKALYDGEEFCVDADHKLGFQSFRVGSGSHARLKAHDLRILPDCTFRRALTLKRLLSHPRH